MVRATDLAGTTATATYGFTVDLTAPTAGLTLDVGGVAMTASVTARVTATDTSV